MSTQTQLTHGLRPVVLDEDEAAIAAMSPEERQALAAFESEWDAWVEELEEAETRRALVRCAPFAAASLLTLVLAWVL